MKTLSTRGANMKKQIIIGILLLVIILGGCGIMEKLPNTTGQENNNQNNEENPGKNYEDAFYVPVQEYKGENFALHPDGDRSLAVIEEEREKVVEEVRKYFQEKYHTDVTVHNIVGTENGVSAFVEAKGEPYFNSIAVIPVDLEKQQVKYDQFTTIEGRVENGIKGGLYVMAYPEEFEKLDQLLEKFAEEHPVTTRNQEVVTHVTGNGYSTPYYFLTPLGSVFAELYDKYTEQPDMTGEEARQFLEDNPFDLDHMVIPIKFFMEEAGAEPDESILEELVTLIEEAEGIPRGSYTIYLHDNNINSRTGSGNKDSTLIHGKLEGIIKE